MIQFFIGALIGFVTGIVLHFRLTRVERRAFDVAVEGKRAAEARVTTLERTLAAIKAINRPTRKANSYERERRTY